VLLVSDDQQGPDIETAQLLVLRSRRCTISGPERKEGRFTLLQCRSLDDQTTKYFVDLCSDLGEWARAEPAVSVGELVLTMVEFFRQLLAPARKTQEGLWAELLLIRQSSRPDVLVRAWHMRADDRYDFSADRQRLEVKAAAGERRVHHFSLLQLNDAQVDVCVVSTVVEPSAGGVSIRELLDDIASSRQLSPRDVIGIRRVVADVLGREWLASANERFDRDRAAASIRFLPAAAIPSIASNCLPDELSDVSFRCDVSAVLGMTEQQLTSAGGVWAAAVHAAAS